MCAPHILGRWPAPPQTMIRWSATPSFSGSTLLSVSFIRPASRWMMYATAVLSSIWCTRKQVPAWVMCSHSSYRLYRTKMMWLYFVSYTHTYIYIYIYIYIPINVVGWLCLTSHRHREMARDGTPFTVLCEGREARFLHLSKRESNPRSSCGSTLLNCCTMPAPYLIFFTKCLLLDLYFEQRTVICLHWYILKVGFIWHIVPVVPSKLDNNSYAIKSAFRSPQVCLFSKISSI